MKPVAITSSKTIDEEALEALMQAEEEEQEELAEGKQVKKLTYDEIGFGPAIGKNCNCRCPSNLNNFYFGLQ